MRIRHWFYTAPLRLRSIFRRNQVELELDEEIRYHVERQIEENIAKGMTEEEARHVALRAIECAARRCQQQNPRSSHVPRGRPHRQTQRR
jgi:macrolide transport system ATP-binding/permease protein